MLSRSLSDCQSLTLNVMIQISQFVRKTQLCHYRDVLLRKNSCSFGHCPNYLSLTAMRAAQEVQVPRAQQEQVLGKVWVQGVRQPLPHLE